MISVAMTPAAASGSPAVTLAAPARSGASSISTAPGRPGLHAWTSAPLAFRLRMAANSSGRSRPKRDSSALGAGRQITRKFIETARLPPARRLPSRHASLPTSRGHDGYSLVHSYQPILTGNSHEASASGNRTARLVVCPLLPTTRPGWRRPRLLALELPG